MKLSISIFSPALQFCKAVFYFSLRVKYSIYRILGVKIGLYRNSNDLQRIGFIDQDGLIHVSPEYNFYFNPNDLFSQGDFLCRKRFSINVLYKDKVVYLVKVFHHNFFAFYNELLILHELREIDCVPKIKYVNYKNPSFVMNYIDGYVLREKFAKFGVSIRDVDKNAIGENSQITQNNVDISSIIKEIVNDELLQNIKDTVKKIHRKKVLIIDIKFGNMLIKNDKAFFVDFNDSILFKYTPAFIFNIIKKSDLFRLNNLFVNIEGKGIKNLKQ